MDVGSGSGTVLIEFARQFPRSAASLVLEPFDHFITTSQKAIHDPRTHRSGIGLATRWRGTNTTLTSEFDLITMVQVFHEVPDRAKADILRRCHQSLKPGGTLLLD